MFLSPSLSLLLALKINKTLQNRKTQISFYGIFKILDMYKILFPCQCHRRPLGKMALHPEVAPCGLHMKAQPPGSHSSGSGPASASASASASAQLHESGRLLFPHRWGVLHRSGGRAPRRARSGLRAVLRAWSSCARGRESAWAWEQLSPTSTAVGGAMLSVRPGEFSHFSLRAPGPAEPAGERARSWVPGGGAVRQLLASASAPAGRPPALLPLYCSAQTFKFQNHVVMGDRVI